MTHAPMDKSSLSAWVSGSGAERRSGQDRRAEQRRTAQRNVSEERRASGERRYWEERRGGYRRRSLEASLGNVGTNGTLARERARARRLLDEFTRLSGPVEQRITKLVRRQWPAYPLGARAFLAERLTALLKGVAEGAPLGDDLRQQVEDAVADWAGRL